MTETAWKSETRRGRPRCPIRISVWTEPGRWMTRTRRPDVDAVSTIGPGRSPSGPDTQLPNRRSAISGHVLAGQIPADDEGRPGRVESAQPRSAQRLGIEAFHGVARAAGRAVIGRGRRVDRVDQCLFHAPARVGLGLEQVVEALVPQAVHLGDREGRVQDDLGEQVERLREPIGRDVEPGGQCVPAGLRVERRAQALGRLDQGDRVVALGPLREGPGGQHGRSRLLGRLVDGTDRQDQRGRHERPAGQVRDEDAQARRQPRLGDLGELVRAWRARDGSLGDDRPVAQRLGGGRHAASSSDSRSSSAWSSAAGPSGRYVRTTRLSTRKTSVAATRMSSGVTAR